MSISEPINNDVTTPQTDSLLGWSEQESSTTRHNSYTRNYFSRLNVSVYLTYLCSTASTALPVVLLPTVANALVINLDDSTDADDQAAYFCSRIASSSLMGTAFGKVINGYLVDLYGAKNTSFLYFLLGALSLVCYSYSTSLIQLCLFNAALEFSESLQWPAIQVVLVELSGSQMELEDGIWISSLASRSGALLAMPLYAFVLDMGLDWRKLAFLGGIFWGFLGAVLMWLAIPHDAKKKQENNRSRSHDINSLAAPLLSHDNDDENNEDTSHARKSRSSVSYWAVLKSTPFWLVTIAHTGDSLLRTSEREVGTYFQDTAPPDGISSGTAGGMAVVLSAGVFVGLISLGGKFNRMVQSESEEGLREGWKRRKNIVVGLYIVAGLASFGLAVLALPFVRTKLTDFLEKICFPSLSTHAITILQLVHTFFMGVANSINYYQIPSLLAATYGVNKGLCNSLFEAVAYALSAILWVLVGFAVESGGADFLGWTYGWTIVTVIITISGIVMVKFINLFYIERVWKDVHRFDDE
uniref:Major facilitator superfamily (MFS) profile domain-containing protein n=1 Tax=Corethron hystrix TaxID=216773 RepID=A0A7S1FZF3_9STRA|mmetsp:Transcript_41157/g.96554  ORF Transcript_41157/g.96554 Transcript_41157/m.96554 type:complete len:527 (+) Transcript_41157:124-1704(+)